MSRLTVGRIARFPLSLSALVAPVLFPAPLQGQSVCVSPRAANYSPWIRQPSQVRIRATLVASTSVPLRAGQSTAEGDVHTLEHVIVHEILGEPRGLAPGGQALIVRWEARHEGPFDCGSGPRGDSILPAEYVFTGRLRPSERWIDGRPTIDVTEDRPNILGGRQSGERLPEEVWELFSRVLPEQEEWDRDCRPPVLRVRDWVASHVGIRSYLSGASFQRWTLLHNVSLMDDCLCLAHIRAHELVRWGSAAEPPPPGAAVLRREGCRPRGEDAPYAHGVFEEAPEWVVICRSADHWRLLVVSAGHRGRAAARLLPHRAGLGPGGGALLPSAPVRWSARVRARKDG